MTAQNTPYCCSQPAKPQALPTITQPNFDNLAQAIKQWGQELGFQQVGIADTDLSAAEQQLLQWLDAGFHGEMEYMARHGSKRYRPAELVPGTQRVISVRLDYLPEPMAQIEAVIEQPELAFISRYALGRDYHKVMRNRLQRLANQIAEQIGPFGYRAFVDSAPVLEKPLAEKAGLGWIGKHSNLLNKSAGSWFFLGELYTDLPLPVDPPATNHCGDCTECISICPTQAIVAPYKVDARRCISYLTIELKGSIPESLRPLIGNRVYGCDDCQLVCPWNRFATQSPETDFAPRQQLDQASLIALFGWDETTFLSRTEGSAIRRIGHQSWIRNIAVALGNSPTHARVLSALQTRINDPDPIIREHTQWAWNQHQKT